jgi:hypothetical protein
LTLDNIRIKDAKTNSEVILTACKIIRNLQTTLKNRDESIGYLESHEHACQDDELDCSRVCMSLKKTGITNNSITPQDKSRGIR